MCSRTRTTEDGPNGLVWSEARSPPRASTSTASFKIPHRVSTKITHRVSNRGNGTGKRRPPAASWGRFPSRFPVGSTPDASRRIHPLNVVCIRVLSRAIPTDRVTSSVPAFMLWRSRFVRLLCAVRMSSGFPPRRGRRSSRLETSLPRPLSGRNGRGGPSPADAAPIHPSTRGETHTTTVLFWFTNNVTRVRRPVRIRSALAAAR